MPEPSLGEYAALAGTRPRVAIRWPVLAFAALCAAGAAVFVAYPTYPTYDSLYALLWGRELVHGTAPSLAGWRHPTEHPLAVALGAVLSLLGEAGARALMACVLASFLALVAGVHALARRCFGALPAVVAAALLCTRFDLPFLAVRGFLDIPYLALVVWAAAWEAARPRRGAPVLVALALAGLLRPEAWVLGALYAVWCRRLRLVPLALAAPMLWLGFDAAVTGDPLFSLHATSGLAAELGRAKGLGAVPRATVRYLVGLAGSSVVAAGAAGALLAARVAPRRAAVPLALLACGLATFAAVGVAGLSVIQRYLLVPAVALVVFAAFAAGGWRLLAPGRLRGAWAVGGTLLIVALAGLTARHVDLGATRAELAYRSGDPAALRAVLGAPAVRRALACGPVSVPTHKLVPDVRWMLGLGARDVVAREAPGPAPRRGVALVVVGREALATRVFVDRRVRPRVNLAPPGFHRIATSRWYAAYARC